MTPPSAPLPVVASGRSLLRRVLGVNLLLALASFVALSALSFLMLSSSAESAAFDDIAAELSVLHRRSEELKVLAFADELEYRTRGERPVASAQRVYLLQRSDGARIAGNLPRWPTGHAMAAGRLRFDGQSAGVSAGRIVAEAIVVDGHFPLLVGRRLESVETMGRRYLPIAGIVFGCFGALAAFLTLRTDRQYRRRIAATNSAFEGLRRGDVTQRIPVTASTEGDEFGELTRNINLALAEIERLVKGLDSYSQSAAHELNRELSRLLEESRASGATKFAASVEGMIELLREILRLARIESGPAVMATQFEVGDTIAAAVDLYRDAAQMADVSLVEDLSRAAGVLLQGESDIVRTAVMNLIENAVKHSPPGSSVTVAADADDASVTISVTDQGPGVAIEDLGELIAARAMHAPQGHGLGLRFVQAVAIRYGTRVLLRNLSPGLRVSMMFPRGVAAR